MGIHSASSSFGLPVVPHLATRRTPSGIHGHHDNGLAVAQIIAVVDGLILLVIMMQADNERGLHPRAIGIRIPEIGKAAERTQGASHFRIPALQQQDRAIAILLFGARKALRHQVKRLIPADTLPLVLTAQLAVRRVQAPAGALQRILDAIFGKHLLALAATA